LNEKKKQNDFNSIIDSPSLACYRHWPIDSNRLQNFMHKIHGSIRD